MELTRISFDDINQEDPHSIRNFILSDSSKKPDDISFNHPVMIDGVIFGICLSGNARIRINLKEYTLVPNTIFSIMPHRVLEPIEKSDDFFVEILFFSFDFINGLPFPKDFDIPSKIAKQPCLTISEEKMRELLEYHAFIVKAYNGRQHAFRNEIARSLLYALLGVIASIYLEDRTEPANRISTRSEEIIEQFIKLLIEYHKQERNASFYADKLCITTKYLSGTLKKITGRSINAWINQSVILEAKLLLKTSKLTVLQISEELNFPNPSFFGRFFKQYAGMTPLEYRES